MKRYESFRMSSKLYNKQIYVKVHTLKVKCLKLFHCTNISLQVFNLTFFVCIYYKRENITKCH